MPRSAYSRRNTNSRLRAYEAKRFDSYMDMWHKGKLTDDEVDPDVNRRKQEGIIGTHYMLSNQYAFTGGNVPQVWSYVRDRPGSKRRR